MIHVDALDFSECRSEEVIRFFWRSVYMYMLKHDKCFQNTQQTVNE